MQISDSVKAIPDFYFFCVRRWVEPYDLILGTPFAQQFAQQPECKGGQNPWERG
jgi:hypothetical protein